MKNFERLRKKGLGINPFTINQLNKLKRFVIVLIKINNLPRPTKLSKGCADLDEYYNI